MDIVTFMLSYKLFANCRSPNRAIFVVSPQSSQKAKPQTTAAGHGYMDRWQLEAPPTPIARELSLRAPCHVVRTAMSLFQFGVRHVSTSQGQNNEGESAAPSHVPTLAESGLGRVEFDATLNNGIGELTDPAPSASKKRKVKGKYTVYTPEQRASIGKYALENGNESQASFSIPLP